MAADKMREIESRGTSVEAAIEEGLRKLALPREKVEIEVIDEGSRGLLGIGSREAVVRLRPVPPAEKPQPIIQPKPVEQPVSVPEPVAVVEEERPRAPEAVAKVSEPEADEDDDAKVVPDDSEDLEAEREAAVAILTELLDKMYVEAQLSSHVSEPDDLTGQQVNIIEITGEDLGILIGPRGETLDSLQFLSRLMVAHELRRRAHFVIDIEGYRQRRRQALARLAERMAEKAKQRGQPVSLEPMSSYERRIIHMTLRDSPDVYTESTGEGKHRKVRIFPK